MNRGTQFAEAMARGFVPGVQMARDAFADKARRDLLKQEFAARAEERDADSQLKERLVRMQLEGDERERSARQHELSAKLEADAIRQFGRQWDSFGDFVAEQNDPVKRLARTKAERELTAMDAPPSADEQLEAEVRRKKLQREMEDLDRPAAGGSPTAKVVQTFGPDGRSRVEFEQPVDEARKMVSAGGYRSPYADEIAEHGRTIAEQGAEIAGGDTRTGLFGIAKSREGIMQSAARKRLRLQALEIQDQLQRGVIDQAEADRQAAALAQSAGIGAGGAK